jgi:hypothetical protein
MVHRTLSGLLVPVLALFLAACGGGSGGSSGAGGGTEATVPPAPTGLMATAGNAQVTLNWNASSGATSYHVKRATVSGGPYTVTATTTVTNAVDTSLSNGTAYYYVVSAVNAAGESANSGEVSVTPTAGAPPPVPTGLMATAGNAQVSLSWSASAGATGYHVKRSGTTGGPYTQVGAPAVASYTDATVANGTTYFYVVSAVNPAGESANSSEVSATPTAAATASVHVTVDVLTNRHPISSYVYGGSYPKDKPTITDSGLTVVRWGGNATSTYNWQAQTDNADNDYFFEDFAYSEIGDSDSAAYIQDVKAAGSNPLMTMVMLPWVAKSAEGSGNGHWSFSVAKYGAQCSVDPYNTDAGNGVPFSSTCASNPVYLTADPNDAYFPLLDQPGTSDPAGSVYRNQWAAALGTAFGTAPHFYDMDNEIDIWGGTHRDIHPSPTTYGELRDIYLTEARALKGWDPEAIRFGPVSCCWYYYWRSATGSSDTSSHGGVDFLPWWLNEVAWSDEVAGARSLDVFDIHAYPDTPDATTLSGFTTAQKQALAVRIYRDWWDPTYTSEASYIENGGFSIEPMDSKPFRIPRMRALLNAIDPGTQFSITEWSAEIVSAADFSTALGDADAYGILGRERVYLASRWEAPDPANPNYQALKLYSNFDGQHHGFGTISVSDTNDGNPSLFSSYAALNSTGTTLTVMVLNKDPQNAVTAQIIPNGFTPTAVTTYTLSQNSPTSIVASSSEAWSSTTTFAPYTATLLVITGTLGQTPGAEWDLNPDTVMVAAGGTVTLEPKISSNAGTVTLTSSTADSGITVTLTQPSVTTAQTGTVTVTAGAIPGFYHFTVSGSDNSGVSETQGGWIVVGNPAATLAKTGDGQTGAHGTTLNLSVTLVPGLSGGTLAGASILFATNAGTLSSSIVTTDSSGLASVVLTLPAAAGAVQVTAEGPFGLGHPVATFTETSQ